MNSITTIILAISATFILNISVPVEVAANTFTCTIKGGNQKSYVVVTDMDPAGNPLRQRGELFQGVLEPDQTQTLESEYGELRYSFKRHNQTRSQGRLFADCRGNTIRLR
jgi:hypothetical protein